jgi:sulfatase modifying factor 1
VVRIVWISALSLLLTQQLACEQLTGKKDAKKEESEEDDEPKKKKKKKDDDGAATASATASAAPPPTASASAATPTDSGPTMTIPSGTLRAGASCGAVPRVTNEELVHPSIAMNEFTIDVYPYPNDPKQPPKTGVTRDEASKLCVANGKRLCTELEWERACKGADNLTFEYAGNYDKAACATPSPLEPGKRSKCKSAFGVADMHGLAYEWTSSAWGRGSGSSLAAIRGYKGTGNVVRERCASGVGRDANNTGTDVGFRCCSGPENAAVVDLSLLRRPVLTDDERIDQDLARDLMKQMPQDHQSIDGVRLSFDKIWRWHPRDNEELVIARWVGRPSEGSPFYEIAVFKICGTTPGRIARIRGPVERIDRMREQDSPEKLVMDVTTDKDKGEVKLTYWYGTVTVTQPDFIKEGNQLKKRKVLKLPNRPTKK